jgi:hypothetical protein
MKLKILPGKHSKTKTIKKKNGKRSGVLPITTIATHHTRLHDKN